MRKKTFAVLLISCLVLTARAQTTTFTYQGYLTANGTAFTGNAEFQPTLWDAATNGNLVAGNSPTGMTVGVTNGLFSMPLDFGDHFPGADRWVQIDVRTPPGTGSFVALTPRQRITSTPYAITAANLSGYLPVNQISGAISSSMIANGAVGAGKVDSSQVQLRVYGTAPSGQFITGIQADGTITSAADTSDWKLNGNAGTTPASQFLGTTDFQPLEFRVDNERAFRLEYAGTASPNIVGGSYLNVVSNGVYGATIAGGGYSVNILGSQFYYPNGIGGSGGTIGGGGNNFIGASPYSTVSGGFRNNAYGQGATIGGGTVNQIGAATSYATIAGGNSNTNSGNYATIPGGQLNVATGDYSFAAGRQAKAQYQGDFVWADSQNSDFIGTGINQFLIRAAGGVGINTNNPSGAALSVIGGVKTGVGGTTQSRVEYGTATVGTGVAGVNTFTITFPTAFSTVPKVFVMTKGNDNPDTFVITTRAVSTTNFKVNIFRIDNTTSGWGQALQVDWYAVE